MGVNRIGTRLQIHQLIRHEVNNRCEFWIVLVEIVTGVCSPEYSTEITKRDLHQVRTAFKESNVLLCSRPASNPLVIHAKMFANHLTFDFRRLRSANVFLQVSAKFWIRRVIVDDVVELLVKSLIDQSIDLLDWDCVELCYVSKLFVDDSLKQRLRHVSVFDHRAAGQ